MLQFSRVPIPLQAPAGSALSVGGGIGDCVDDTFVLSGSGKGSPVICGSNSGQHGDKFENMLEFIAKPLINLKSENKIRQIYHSPYHEMLIAVKIVRNKGQMKFL